jgi:lysophospholipase L1-like esterase
MTENPEQRVWVDAWSSAVADASVMQVSVQNQTIRTILIPSISGTHARIIISNEAAAGALEIGGAQVSRLGKDGSIAKGSRRMFTFNESAAAIIEKGMSITSDPADFRITAQDKIVVDLFIVKSSGYMLAQGGVDDSFTTSGNAFSQTEAKDFKSIIQWDAATKEVQPGSTYWTPFLCAVQTSSDAEVGTIVSFGDSISTLEYEEYLSKNLINAGIKNLTVVREAICGNRLLKDSPSTYPGLFGKSGISRFEKAITGHTNVKYMIVLQGINDINFTEMGNMVASDEQPVTPGQIIEGYKKCIETAHRYKVKIIGATIMPMSGCIFATDNGEAKRQSVNNWIRTSGAFDSVIDFDKAVQDPADPKKLLETYDSGDHLHQNNAGSKAMADAIDVDLFRMLL